MNCAVYPVIPEYPVFQQVLIELGPVGFANALNAEDGLLINTTSKNDTTTRTTALPSTIVYFDSCY